uniref:Uncharacterized protein n=1 Tax=Panagrolaimus sp. PS1159 TaxID=55785 RepID=A0AC35FFV0_9BILA
MGRKPTRKQATNHEGRNGSKESGTKRQATVRKHAAKVASQQEDDGTQIEGTQQRKPSPRRVKRKEGEKTLNEANAYNQSLRQFSLATCESGVQALADEFTRIKLMGQANIPPKTAFDANP